MANEHNECIVGLLHYVDYSDLVTLEKLKEHIADRAIDNILFETNPVLKGCQNLKKKVWTLQQYADWRSKTNLQKFSYCPRCGKFIDWREIRRAEDGAENH
jgi:hypothetical protein